VIVIQAADVTVEMRFLIDLDYTKLQAGDVLTAELSFATPGQKRREMIGRAGSSRRPSS
jgi:hypothetical protein